MKKTIACLLFAGAASVATAAAVDAMNADPDVRMTALTVQQRYPWNGKVDIDLMFTDYGLGKEIFANL